MTGWSFLVSRRWLGYLALTIAFAIACCALGSWQLNRRAEARAEIARIDANYDAAPSPIEKVLPDRSEFDTAEKWVPVEATGHYLSDDEVLVRNRPRGGSTGFEVLTPLELADGSVFVVDRGWIPSGSAPDTVGTVPTPPAGNVTVVARLKAGEPVVGGRTASGDQVATINLAELEQRWDHPLYTGAYGLLVSENPPAPAQPAPAIRPERDEGPHLSYAFQWFVFALMAFIGLGWAARQEKRANEAVADESAGQPPRPVPLRRVTDADIEDSILDHQF